MSIQLEDDALLAVAFTVVAVTVVVPVVVTVAFTVVFTVAFTVVFAVVFTVGVLVVVSICKYLTIRYVTLTLSMIKARIVAEVPLTEDVQLATKGGPVVLL